MSGEQPDFLSTIELETGRMADLSAKNLHLSVPHIEGWTTEAVIGHFGWLCYYVAKVLESDPDSPPRRSDIPEPPHGAEVLDWYQAGRSTLLETMARVEPDTIVPSFTGPQPAQWWHRRFAHEAAMHRWDCQSAIGSPTPIDARIARDGVDEVFEVFAPSRLQYDVLDAAGKTLHLHATDIDDGEWMIRPGAESIEWSHGHEKGDVAARGPVADLLLMLWSRIPPSRLEVFGEQALLDRWQAAAAF